MADKEFEDVLLNYFLKRKEEAKLNNNEREEINDSIKKIKAKKEYLKKQREKGKNFPFDDVWNAIKLVKVKALFYDYYVNFTKWVNSGRVGKAPQVDTLTVQSPQDSQDSMSISGSSQNSSKVSLLSSPGRTTDETVSTSSDTNTIAEVFTDKKRAMSRSRIPIKEQNERSLQRSDSFCSTTSSTFFSTSSKSSPFKPIESYPLYTDRKEILLPENHPFALEKRKFNSKLVKPALSHRHRVRVTLTDEEVASILEKQQDNAKTILGKR
jgi:hypothetical protein